MVYVIDDDKGICDFLRSVLECRGFGVMAFDGARHFLDHLPKIGPDPPPACLIADIKMPGMTGTQLHDELIRRGVPLPIIFLTAHGTVPLAVSSMKKGAVDFVQKPFNAVHLCEIVSRALERARECAEGNAAARRTRMILSRLTAREAQILDCIVAGKMSKEIADGLKISMKTVEFHRANIMEKIAVNSIADLMTVALAARGA